MHFFGTFGFCLAPVAGLAVWRGVSRCGIDELVGCYVFALYLRGKISSQAEVVKSAAKQVVDGHTVGHGAACQARDKAGQTAACAVRKPQGSLQVTSPHWR